MTAPKGQSEDGRRPSLFAAARECLLAADVDEKLRLTHEAAAAWAGGRLALAAGQAVAVAVEPGRPSRPRLVAPRFLARRGLGSPEGHAAFIHAIAHIEFNAVNLAWDAVQRFRNLPGEFYDDWVRIAAEEAGHFALLRAHLESLGYAYGDFDAHDGLWSMARETAADPLDRMALVPRVLEARGLDVTPAMIERLEAAGDRRGGGILRHILSDEIGHVAAGSRWFRYLCEQRGLNPERVFPELLARHMKGTVRGPLHLAARRQAGFSEEELRLLENLGTDQPRQD